MNERCPFVEPPARRNETELKKEQKFHLGEIDKLLSTIIEVGPNLPSDLTKKFRTQVIAHLNALGFDNMNDFTIARINGKFDDKTHLSNPEGYPDKDFFRNQLNKIYSEKKDSNLPNISKKPLASDVCRYGQCEWKEIGGRGSQKIVDYAYELGKLLSNEISYSLTIDKSDSITIGNNWRIENGRHRALTLKALGEQYIQEKGMNNWIEVSKEN